MNRFQLIGLKSFQYIKKISTTKLLLINEKVSINWLKQNHGNVKSIFGLDDLSLKSLSFRISSVIPLVKKTGKFFNNL